MNIAEAKDYLMRQPGVGHKTASCVLLFSLGKPSLPVDTHIFRVAKRLKIYAGPQVSQAEFRKLCSDAAQKGQDAEVKKISATFDRKIQALVDKINQEERQLDQDKTEYSQRKMDELGAGFDALSSLFGGRKRSIAKNLAKRRMTSEAKADIQESEKAIADYQEQVEKLTAEKAAAVEDILTRWGEIAAESETMNIPPLKKDILLDFFGIGWFPYYQVQVGDEMIELPGFGNA